MTTQKRDLLHPQTNQYSSTGRIASLRIEAAGTLRDARWALEFAGPRGLDLGMARIAYHVAESGGELAGDALLEWWIEVLNGDTWARPEGHGGGELDGGPASVQQLRDWADAVGWVYAGSEDAA